MKPFIHMSMMPFVSAVVALISSIAAGNVHSDDASAATSISEIGNTLRNLLRSVEDNGRDAEALHGRRQQWCDSAIHNFEAASQAAGASLVGMQSQLLETQAEVEGAKGTVQQVKVDIEMVQHTLKQTSGMLKGANLLQAKSESDTRLLGSLVDNKQLSRSSLEQELKLTVPVLAQLEASLAETRQRISYRTESVDASKDFIAALKDGCQAASDRAETQAAARMGESNSIQVALQALGDMGQKKDDAQDDAQDGQASSISFVQMTVKSDEVTTDDLSDLFAADQKQHASRVQQQSTADVATAPSLRPRIQTLLSQLKNAGSGMTELDQAAWCSKQRESSKMALKFAQDSVAQVTSEMNAHANAEAEFSEHLQTLQAVASAVTASAKTAMEQASKEEAVIQSSSKDQVLATKILDQAMTILHELALVKSTKAVAGLASAKKMLKAQIEAAAGFKQEASARAKAIEDAALVLTQAQESEQHNLELARDEHASQRLASVTNKQLYEADVQEATAFVQKLEESCQSDAEHQAEQQRSVQTHALEDADKALSGKLVEAVQSTANRLRGPESGSSRPLPNNLTPMQRAAAEMGIAVDQ